ncbi:MAG: hypothetical protein WAN54_12315, partial [Syntrophobacteraceae bacterium]
RMFTSFYLLLLKADPSPPADAAPQKLRPPVSAKQPKIQEPKVKATPAAATNEIEAVENGTPLLDEKPHGSHGRLPQLHINIQLHISPEASTEQIDKIFESMARHLKDFRI